MKVQELKLAVVESKENTDSLVKNNIKADEKFLKRSKRAIEDKIEDLETALEKRLSSDVELDKSVVEVLYKEIKDEKLKLELYKEFEEEFYK